MGDRNNPIKFGPEWLRNLPRERSTGNSNPQSSPAAAGAAGGSGAAAASSSTNTNTPTTPNSNKVQLAKLRYGREEMLALYDRTSEAPLELKHIDVLYQTRGKPPVALNNTFEEDMRDRDARTGPSTGGMLPGERFGTARSLGRGLTLGDGRGRPRMPFVRQTSAGRGASWHGSPRMPGYSGTDEEPSTLRSWNNSSGTASATRNSSGDPSDWNQNKMFRSKRQGTSTNWRQPTRDDEEWRGQDSGRARSSQQEKWERDWGDRQQDKPPSWSSNRRTWVAGESQSNEDNLPEWATDGAEACAGTFDSSGAFHGGYSNDDTNLPKNPETAFPLTRSHTHGSFVRSKTVEEGSEEWWASEKAKKLSPKRFDASEIKFKKPATNKPESSNTNTSTNKEDSSSQKTQEKSESPLGAAAAVSAASDTSDSNIDDSIKKHLRFSQSKTFDSLMRPDINMEEASDERSNFQSVMITPNNSLRTKHQNIVASVMLDSNKDSRQPCMMPYKPSNQVESDDKINELLDMTLEDKEGLLMPSGNDGSLVNSATACISSGMSTMVNSMSQMPIPMQLGISNAGLANQGMQMNDMSNMPSHGMHPGMQASGMQQVGITNSALNASLGLPLGGPNNTMNQAMGILPLQGVPPPVLPNPNMNTSGMQSSVSGMPGFPPSSGLPGMPNVGNNSLFLGQNSNNSTLQSPSDIPMPNHGNPANIFPLHNLQHPSNSAFGSSVYSNMMQHNAPPPSSNAQNYSLADHWYYEDPKKDIQGPFTSKDMYSWFRAGFFSPSLMVRRACDNVMHPLGSYGPVVPFAPMDMMLAMSGRFEPRNQTPQGLGLDVAMNMPNLSDPNSLQFGTVGLMRNPPFAQQPMVNSGFNGAAREGEPRRAPPEVDSLWGQPSPPELLWMQAMNTQRNDNRVNNLSMFFWDQQLSAITSNSLLPEEIAKEMKTEDQILAQLRASQNINPRQNLHFMDDSAAASPAPAAAAATAPPPAPSKNSEDPFGASVNNAPNLEDLQNFIQEDTLKNIGQASDNYEPQLPQQVPKETTTKDDPTPVELNNSKSQSQVPNKPSETKVLKQTKNEIDKTKNKENNNTKNKNKKSKDEKKDDTEIKNKDDDTIKSEKKSEESSPVKNKKEDKQNKKEIEKEKKEWLKDGFTIVKGAEKNATNKKKNEESKATEEAERKRKEEDRLAAEEEKQRKQVEALKRQQETQQQQQRQILESMSKRAPWSTAGGRDGPTLAEIQRLEREKKLEQIKEQQHMMQLIAQQQAAAMAREQEMQAGLGWAKKKNATNMPGQSLAEIQAEARKLASSAATAAAVAAIAQAEEARALSPSQLNMSPWGNADNSVGGFWDTPPSQSIKPQPLPKSLEQTKSKKKAATLNLPPKKEVTPAVEFESWCTTVLASWSAKIDVPTFVGFLKDIESPYEVKDYVKCYLGESKETGDFARQFLERRSKMLRVGMVTPSDDLCSPALAVNPRTVSGSDYQEVKGKGKKTKKNKMFKVDARILGFSVTAAEDRINVGDIDTA